MDCSKQITKSSMDFSIQLVEFSIDCSTLLVEFRNEHEQKTLIEK